RLLGLDAIEHGLERGIDREVRSGRTGGGFLSFWLTALAHASHTHAALAHTLATLAHSSSTHHAAHVAGTTFFGALGFFLFRGGSGGGLRRPLLERALLAEEELHRLQI